MEATIFTGWIYDHLLPHAEKVKVAHPLMLRAIAAAKRKNDKIDASKVADCLRCDFLPECYMTTTEIRDRRRTLRYRGLLVKQMVQMKNRISGLLIETGVSYNKHRLHKGGYFDELMSGNEEIDASIQPLRKLSREAINRSQKLDYALVSSLERDQLLAERLERLRTIPGVGRTTALTWVLEMRDTVLRLNLELRHQVLEDPLTGLANQRETFKYTQARFVWWHAGARSVVGWAVQEAAREALSDNARLFCRRGEAVLRRRRNQLGPAAGDGRSRGTPAIRDLRSSVE